MAVAFGCEHRVDCVEEAAWVRLQNAFYLYTVIIYIDAPIEVT